MVEYVLKRQNTVAQYITMQPILDLYKETVRMTGTWVGKCGGNRKTLTWREQGPQWRQRKKRENTGR